MLDPSEDDEEMSITCIGKDVQLAMVKEPIDVENQLFSQLPVGAVLYLLEKRADGLCRVTSSPNAESFLVPASKLNFQASRSR